MTTWLSDIPLVCKSFEERHMERDLQEHAWVELVGGPLDGKRLKEEDVKFDHKSSSQYLIKGHIYAPMKVTKIGGKNVLKLKHVGAHKGK